MTRREMVKMLMEHGFPYILASAFAETYRKYGYDNLYEGRPVSEELDKDMVVLSHVPIEHISFKAKHPNFGECIFTLQKYIRTKDRKYKPCYCMFIFNKYGEILDERGVFPEREVVSDMDHMDVMEDNIKIPGPRAEIKYITTSPA